MDWKQIVGVMLFGSIPSFLPLWLEDMWSVGSWQWGALTVACLIVGIVLINWDRWSISIRNTQFISRDNATKPGQPLHPEVDFMGNHYPCDARSDQLLSCHD